MLTDPVDGSLTIYQNTQEESEDYQMTADEIAIHEAFSKLFKKLALKLHPDRINKFLPEDEKEIRAKEFKQAKKEAKQLKGTTHPVLGKPVATMPAREFFRLTNKYGHDEVHSKEFIKYYNKQFEELSPNKI